MDAPILDLVLYQRDFFNLVLFLVAVKFFSTFIQSVEVFPVFLFDCFQEIVSVQEADSSNKYYNANKLQNCLMIFIIVWLITWSDIALIVVARIYVEKLDADVVHNYVIINEKIRNEQKNLAHVSHCTNVQDTSQRVLQRVLFTSHFHNQVDFPAD